MSDHGRGGESGDRRSFLGGALLDAAATPLLAAGAQPGPGAAEPATANRQALSPGGAPAADIGYSPGILAEGRRLIFVSGQGPADRKADMETQIRQTFDRIGLVLQEAGASFGNVVMLRSYFVHLARDLPIYRKVRRDYLVEPYPASTAVGTTELAFPDLEIEIEAIAVL